MTETIIESPITQVMVLGTGSKAGNLLRAQITAEYCNKNSAVERVITLGCRSTLSPHSFQDQSEAAFTGQCFLANLRPDRHKDLLLKQEEKSLTTAQNYIYGAGRVRLERTLLVAPGAQERRARLLGRKAYGAEIPLAIVSPEVLGFEMPKSGLMESATEFGLRALSRPFLWGLKPGNVEGFEKRMKIPDKIAQLGGAILGKTILRKHQALAGGLESS